jgi:hypothetical protein
LRADSISALTDSSAFGFPAVNTASVVLDSIQTFLALAAVIVAIVFGLEQYHFRQRTVRNAEREIDLESSTRPTRQRSPQGQTDNIVVLSPYAGCVHLDRDDGPHRLVKLCDEDGGLGVSMDLGHQLSLWGQQGNAPLPSSEVGF